MVDQLQLPPVQAFSAGADFSQLARLGDVYREAQDRARQQQALAALGNDPVANNLALIHSGIPSLVTLGMTGQQRAIENARSGSYLDIAKAQAQRQQEAADLAEEQRKAAPALYERMFGTSGAQPNVQQPGVRPFPAPLPGAMPQGMPMMPPGAQPPTPVTPQPPIDPANLDARIAQSAQALPGSGAAYPGVTPLPGAPPAATPPLMAADENQGLPAWAGPQSTAAQGTAARMVDTMVAGQPAASAGIDNKILAAALANPETKAIATVFAQNKFNPGTWKIEKLDDGRVIAIDEKDPTRTKDITPPTPGGGLPMNKDDRERQNIYDDAIKSGFTPEQALFMKFNKGKPPSADMSPKEIQSFNEFNNTARTADIFVSNLKRLQSLSDSAYEGYLAQGRANVETGTLGSKAPQAALDTQKMVQIAKENAALQLRSTFGSRPAAVELTYLQQLESNPLMPRDQRNDIYKRLIERFSEFSAEDKAKAQAIQEGTLYRKGPGASATAAASMAAATPTPPTAPPTAAASIAKPTLGDFMAKARVANPGVPDGELARYWKDKYGG